MMYESSTEHENGTSAGGQIEPVVSVLDERMKAAGMMSVTEMLERNHIDKWIGNHAVTDLESFERWIRTKREEFIRLQARIELDKEQDGDLYEWAVAHNAVFSEVLVNFRQAMSESH